MSEKSQVGSNLLELYQDIILKHSKTPKNIGILKNSDCCQKENNPLCGDKVTVSVALNNTIDETKIVKDILFDGKGCAISIASASMMTEATKGLTLKEIIDLADGISNICKDQTVLNNVINSFDEINKNKLSSLQALTGVRNYPARLRCVTLPWDALTKCLSNRKII